MRMRPSDSSRTRRSAAHRTSLPSLLGRGLNREAEDSASLRTIGIFYGSVLCGRVHADALHGQFFPIPAHVEHGEIELIRAIEIHSLRVAVGRRVALAGEIVQTGLGSEAAGGA